MFDDIKTPEDILEFMKSNIKYGWLDFDDNEHINTMKEFRRKYRTSSLEETLFHGLGTCIEQVYLMHTLLDKLNITFDLNKYNEYIPVEYRNNGQN